MGQSTSANSPFTVTKRIEQVIATRTEKKENQVLGDHEDGPTHRENIKFTDRIDESFRGSAMRINNSKAKQDDSQSAAQEQFFVESAMRYFNVDGGDRNIKHVFKKLLFPALKVIDLPVSTIVFREGEDGTNAYLVEEGELEVSDANGAEYCLIGKGHVFGETSLLFDRERNATVTTITKTRLRSLDRSSFGIVQMALSKNAKLNQHAQRFLELGPVVDLPWCFQERVANQLTSVSYNRGKRICSEGICSTNTIVIERGVIHVHVPTTLLAMAEPHRTMLDSGRQMSTGWDINAVSSLPDELLHAMGISLPFNDKNGLIENEDPTSETSDDVSVNSDNTQQTGTTQMTNKYGSTAVRSLSLVSANSSSIKNKISMKSNFDQMVTGKLQDALTANLRRSSTSVSNIDRSSELSLLRQSQRSPSNASLPLSTSQRGLVDIIDRNVTTVANGGIDGNLSTSSKQLPRRSSSVSSISPTQPKKSPRMLPKIGSESNDISNSTLLASSQKELNRSRSSSIDIYPMNGSVLNSITNSTPATSSSPRNHNNPDRSPSLMVRKSSLLSTAEEKQIMNSVLSLSGKNETKTDAKQSGSCKVIREDEGNSDDGSMDSHEETGQLAPLRDVSLLSLSQRFPTQMRTTPSPASSGMTADALGRSKPVNHQSNANTTLLLSSSLQSDTIAGLSGSERMGIKRANSTSRASSVLDSTSDESRESQARRVSISSSKLPSSSALLLSARRGSSSSLLPSQQSDTSKTANARRGSKLLFMSLVENFVAPPQADTTNEEKDYGYVVTDISDHGQASHRSVSPVTNGIPTNTVNGAMDEYASSCDGDDRHGSSSVGGGGQLKLQSKSPPPSTSSSERYPMANNRIAPLDSPTTIPTLDRSSRGVTGMQTLLEKQTFAQGSSPSNEEQQPEGEEDEEESQVIIALGPGCMIGKHCLDSLMNRPGAPEWKDEILQGTLNVGSVSSITAVVPSDSSDRVQVMCLSSYGFQKAIGNALTTNGFERQIPLTEVVQNLKDDYTSTYVIQGAHRRSSGLSTFTMDSFEELKEIKRLVDGVGEVMKATICLPEEDDDGDRSPESSITKWRRRGSFGSFSNGISPGESFTSAKGWERSMSFQLIASLGMGGIDTHSAAPSASPIMFKAAAAAVLVADHNSGNRECVLKIFRKAKLVDSNKVAAALRESSILSSPVVQQCPFIVKLIGKFQTSDSLVMVMDHVDRRDLKTLMTDFKNDHVPREKRINNVYYYINQPPQLALDLVKYYTASVIAALSHLHRHRIIYRNLKPENIMIDKGGHVKLIDMSCAKILPFHDSYGVLHNRTYTICGLAEYICPEMIQRTGHNSAVDCWQVGILLYELLTGKTPFVDAAVEFRTNLNSGKKAIHRVSDGDAKIMTSIATVQFKGVQKILPTDVCDSLNKVEGSLELVLALLNTIPNNRLPLILNPTSAICKSSFFKNFDWKGLLAGTMFPPYVPPPVKAPVNTENITNRRLSFTSLHAPVPSLPIKKETISPIEHKNFMEATSASLSAIATHSTASSSSTNGHNSNSISANSKNKISGNVKQPTGRTRGGSKAMIETPVIETPRKLHVDHDNDPSDNDRHQVTEESLFDGF